MSDLILPLKSEFFDQIKDGIKTKEYRLCTPYWNKRIQNRCYDRVILTKGYPARDDHARRLVLPWLGYSLEVIVSPFFGSDPVRVYAINVEGKPL